MVKVSIYALSDPRSLRVRYIGQSIDPRQRLIGHLSAPKSDWTPKTRWLRKLAALGLKPILTVIDEVEASMADEAEVRWIAAFKAVGILNLSPGGFRIDYTPEVRLKMSLKARARVHGPLSAATRAKLKANAQTPERKEQLRAAGLKGILKRLGR